MSTIKIDTDRILCRYNPLVLGQFVEHYGKTIYGGVCSTDGSMLNDAIVPAIRTLRVPVLRWPGGNFASGYHWQEGVGPREERPVSFDLEWQVEESNAFGTAEYLDLCRRIGCKAYICANAGSGSAEEAARWVEYCNYGGDSRFARLRRAHGHADVFRVHYWGIGNEVYGRGQIGRMDIDGYIDCVKEYSRLMKKVDPTIELVAVGWERSEWNYRLVKEAGEYFDYLALHSYHPTPDSFSTAMALPNVFSEQLREMLGAIDSASYYIKERRGSPIGVAVDEWNLREWDHLRFIEWLSLAYRFNPRNRELEAKRSDLVREPVPLSPQNTRALMSRSVERDQEDTAVTLTDALYSAAVINRMIRRGDRVSLGGFSPMVNGKGVLSCHEERLVLRPTYHVFALYGRLGEGDVLDIYVESESDDFFVASEAQNFRRTTTVHHLDAVVVARPEGLSLAVVNRSLSSPCECTIIFEGCDPQEVTAHCLTGETVEGTNTVHAPSAVAVARDTLQAVARPDVRIFPPHSLTLLEYSYRR